jgi:hypothetical protein
MEFLMYLTPVGQEIITGVMNKNYNVRENAAICRNKQLLGVVRSPDFIICLDNIKNSVSPVKHYVNETVYHEAVHVAQSCKRGPLGIKNPKLDSYKLNDVARSVSQVNSYPVFEVEAYYLEDKPEMVLEYLKKYCF